MTESFSQAVAMDRSCLDLGGHAGLALGDQAVKKPDQVSPRLPTQMAKGVRGST